MAVGVRIELNQGLFKKDPLSSDLGRRIVRNSVQLIDEVGFESFNFKLLAGKIQSTEASVYRYFENKHLLLLYLVNWYWEWVSYMIDLNTRNIEDPDHKLRLIIKTFVQAAEEDPSNDYMNESVLHRLVIVEGVKSYHSKSIDDENKEGFFLNYKRMVEKVAGVITEINDEFPYPRALATNLFEMANNHRYFSEHLPRLTDIRLKKGELQPLVSMLETFAFGLLKQDYGIHNS